MPTENFNLPLITDNMANDVVRDMNALAEATDGALKGLGDSKASSTDLTKLQTLVTSHLAESDKYTSHISSDTLQSVASETDTKIVFTIINKDDSGMSTIGPTSKITIRKAGTYYVKCYIVFAINPNGTRRLTIRVNGTDISTTTQAAVAGENTFIEISTLADLREGDVIECFTAHNIIVPINIFTQNFYVRKLV